MKLPFGPKARKHKQAIEQAKRLLNRMATDKEQQLEHDLQIAQDAAENATRAATFHATTIWQLQMLIDQLKEENILLKTENSLATSDAGVITLSRAEAKLVRGILDRELTFSGDDDIIGDARPAVSVLVGRLEGAL